MEEEVNRLSSLLSSSESRQKCSTQKIEEKQKEIEDLVFRVEETEIRAQELGEEADKEREEREALKMRLGSEENMNKMFSRELEDLKLELKNLEEEMSVALFREEEQKKLVAELEGRLTEKEGRNDLVKDEDEKINLEIEKLREMLKEEEGRAAASKKGKEGSRRVILTQSFGDESESVKSLEKQVRTLQSQLSDSADESVRALANQERQILDADEAAKVKDVVINELKSELEASKQLYQDKLVQQEIELIQKLETLKTAGEESLKREKEDLESINSRLLADRKELFDELNESKTHFQTTNEKLKQMQSKLDEIEKSKMSISSNKDFLEIQISSKDFEILSLEEQITNLGKSLADANHLADSLQEELDATADDLQAEISSLSEEFSVEKELRTALEGELSATQREKDGLFTQLTSSRNFAKDVQNEKAKCESELLESERNLEELRREIREKEKTTREIRESEEVLMERCSRLEARLSRADIDCGTQREKCLDLGNINKSLLEQEAIAKTREADRERVYESEKANSRRILAENEEMGKDLDLEKAKLIAALSDLESEKKEREMAVSESSAKKDAAKSKIDHLEFRLFEKSEEVESIRDKYCGLERKVSSQKAALTIKDDEICTLREDIVTKEEEARGLKKRIDDLEKEAETFRAFVERKTLTEDREEERKRKEERGGKGGKEGEEEEEHSFTRNI